MQFWAFLGDVEIPSLFDATLGEEGLEAGGPEFRWTVGPGNFDQQRHAQTVIATNTLLFG